ncbi:MAG: L-serine ammonia-lyase [Calditrichaeota bacterium]|nr:L-serine ammonia-lyase [Calditrichota bacterium]HQU72832.1 L-serine ammonia-lyase [Calditrichia bacterium]
MFISALSLFKIGIGPSSSHTMGPMVAAVDFLKRVGEFAGTAATPVDHIQCTLKGSLAFTGKGHATDKAVALGLHGYTPDGLAKERVGELVAELFTRHRIVLNEHQSLRFNPETDIVFDFGDPLPEHPNGMIFELFDAEKSVVLKETYFSIGGGFINTKDEIENLRAPLQMEPGSRYPYPFASAKAMLDMSHESGLSIADMKRQNEYIHLSEDELNRGLDAIWEAMVACINNGLQAEGILPGGLNVQRRAKHLYTQLRNDPAMADQIDWLCTYAMAVNEENAAGHMVVTAPTNGAAGVIPAVLYYMVQHEHSSRKQIHDFLLTAGAIGGLIKHRSSISGAEVGCQGEVGSAAAMAAAGLCAIHGGSTRQIEDAAEMALEHHMGMTCDPVRGLVQVPCIERNGFGAVKAYTAALLAKKGSGSKIMPLDNCIAAMKETGLEMSHKYKETSLGGLAVSVTEC